MDLRKLSQTLGALGVACTAVPLLFTVSSTFVFGIFLLYGMLTVTLLRKLALPVNIFSFAVTAVAFVVTARFTNEGYSIVSRDMAWMVVGGGLGIGAVAITESDEDFNRFLHQLMRFFLLLGLVGSVTGLIKLGLSTAGSPLTYFTDERGFYIEGTSTTSEYNTYSYVLTLALGAAFWLRRHDASRLVRDLGGAGIPLMAMALAFTGSRRAWLFVLMGVAFLLIGKVAQYFGGVSENERELPKNRNWIAYVMLIAVVGAFSFRAESLWDQIEVFMDNDEVEQLVERSGGLFGEQGMESRAPYYEHSIELFLSRSLTEEIFGTGFEYVAQFAGAFHTGQEDYPHNFLLSSLLYGGILQTVLLMACLWTTTITLFRVRGEFGALFFMHSCTLLFSLVSSNSYFSIPMSSFILLFGSHPLFVRRWQALQQRRRGSHSESPASPRRRPVLVPPPRGLAVGSG